MFRIEQLLNNEDPEYLYHTQKLSWVSRHGSSLVPSLHYSNISPDPPGVLQIGLPFLEFYVKRVTLCVLFCFAISLSTFILKWTVAIPSCKLFWIKLPWTFMNTPVCGHMFLLNIGKYLSLSMKLWSCFLK